MPVIFFLIAPKRGAMQEMLTVCSEFCKENCLTFNVKKSKALFFGPKGQEGIKPLMLDGKCVEYVQQWKYLGVTVVAGRCIGFSSKPILASFYRSVNSILSAVRRPDELVLMNLLYFNCVPVLTYSAGAVEFSSSEMRQCNTALNDAIRRIYSYNRWESTRYLRQQLGFSNLYEIFEGRLNLFMKGNLHSKNEVIAGMTAVFLSGRLLVVISLVVVLVSE